MFTKPISLDKQPFPYSVMQGLLGNYSWQTLLGYSSTKLIPIVLFQVISVAGVLALLIFGLLIILLFDGDLVSNGIIAWFLSAMISVATIVIAKRLLRELVAMARLLRRVRAQEKLQQQKIDDLRIHL